MKGFTTRFRELKTIRYDWMLMIILCSLLGFVVENLWNYFTNGYADNRDMFLPFLIGYGIAILLVYLFFGTPTKRTLPLYFLKVFIFSSVAEIALGYTVEAICGFRYWDYTPLPLHFTPYTSLFTSLGFALIISLFMNVHFKAFMSLFKNWVTHKSVRIISSVIIILMGVDWLASFIRMSLLDGDNEIWIITRKPFNLFTPNDAVIAIAMFFIFSFLGWCMESTYISWMNKKWTNRGLMKSPLCPIYGFGEFIGYRLMLLLPQNYFLIFFLGMTFCTLFELLVAKYMIWKSGYVLWDYTNRPFNYKGILCLESSIAWGVIAVAIVGFGHTAIENLLRMIPSDILTLIVVMLIVYTIGDLIYSIRKFRTEGIQAEANNILKVR
ncbi:MAG: putative ABC transporter permease [Eubacterium sp.]|nr:putative ABC transporter permease [Eubacterium sp.]